MWNLYLEYMDATSWYNKRSGSIMTLHEIQELSDKELRIRVHNLRYPTDQIEYAGNGFIACSGLSGQQIYALIDGNIDDYPKDLNAMHELWITMNPELRYTYELNLAQVTNAHPECNWNITNATARQRSEAFVLTMQKESDE